MTQEELEKLKYPIGHFDGQKPVTLELLAQYIATIACFPQRLEAETAHLSDEQLDTPYRPEGWTIRQVVHHCADSHINALMRIKVALTEENPTIKPYDEAACAELADYKLPVNSSLLLLKSVHERWVVLLKSLSPTDLKRTFVHPEHGATFVIDTNTGLYAWHCDHHLAHITTLKQRKNWG
jgi:DinB superfamily